MLQQQMLHCTQAQLAVSPRGTLLPTQPEAWLKQVADM